MQPKRSTSALTPFEQKLPDTKHKVEGARHVVAREDPVHMQTHQGMSLYMLTAGEQLAADVAAERAHT